MSRSPHDDAQPADDRPPTTRLAPSPTGALHLGNARTFLVNWALARRRGWRIVLRMEDLDGPRVKSDAAAGVVETLAWLGLDWDEGPVLQSGETSAFERAMATLASRGLAFPSDLTRAQIEAAASAPHDTPDGPAESRFPPELRPALGPREFTRRDTNWRLVVDEEDVGFLDDVHGPIVRNPARSVGDFVLWTKRGRPAYQLAVTVDDARQGVTHVVRADDLLDSTARQLLLYRALDLRPPSRWMHLPLVIGPDGRRLAKRHGDSRLAHYRGRGVDASRLIGLLARWTGLTRDRTPMDAAEFAERLDPASMPRSPVTFTPEDDAWLLRGS